MAVSKKKKGMTLATGGTLSGVPAAVGATNPSAVGAGMAYIPGGTGVTAPVITGPKAPLPSQVRKEKAKKKK